MPVAAKKPLNASSWYSIRGGPAIYAIVMLCFVSKQHPIIFLETVWNHYMISDLKKGRVFWEEFEIALARVDPATASRLEMQGMHSRMEQLQKKYGAQKH